MRKKWLYFVGAIIGVVATGFLFSTNSDYIVKKSEITKQDAIETAIAFADSKSFSFTNYSYDISPNYFFLDADKGYSELNLLNYAYFKLKDLKNVIMQMDEKSIPVSNWSFRFFTPMHLDELKVELDMKGRVSSFNIREHTTESIEDLGEEASKKIAREHFKSYLKDRGLSISKYTEYYPYSSKIEHGVKRIFIFESKFKIGDLNQRVTVTVLGDRVISFESNVPVPYSFRSYLNKLRFINNAIQPLNLAVIVSIFLGILYLFFRAIYYRKISLVFIKRLIILIVIVKFLVALSRAYSLFDYNPQISIGAFYASRFLTFITNLFAELGQMIPIVVAGVYLDKKAFPKNVSIESIFNPKYIASQHYLDSIGKAYFFAGIEAMAGYAFYEISKIVGWMPGPEVSTLAWVSELSPVIKSVDISIKAGLIEEFFFRVIPISIAVIIANRNPKYRKRIIVLGIVIQIIMFGAGHMNYPSIPFYFRVVELVVPSFLFALVYIKLGAITAVVYHMMFDFFLLTLAISPNLPILGYTHLVLAVLVAAIPVIAHYVFKRYYKPEVLFNKDMKTMPENRSEKKSIKAKIKDANINKLGKVFLFLTSIMFIVTMFRTPNVENPNLEEVTKEATRFAKDRGMDVENPILFQGSELKEVTSPKAVHLLKNREFSNYNRALDKNLLSNSIEAIFEESDRKVSISLNKNGEVKGFNIDTLDTSNNDTIPLEEAKELVESYIEELYGSKIESFVSSSIYKNEDRENLILKYKLVSDIPIEVKAVVSGGEIISISRYYKLTEVEEFKAEGNRATFNILLKLFIVIFIFILVTYFIKFRFKSIAFSKRGAILSAALTLLFLIKRALDFREVWAISEISTLMSKAVVTTIVSTVIAGIFIAGLTYFFYIYINNTEDKDHSFNPFSFFLMATVAALYQSIFWYLRSITHINPYLPFISNNTIMRVATLAISSMITVLFVYLLVQMAIYFNNKLAFPIFFVGISAYFIYRIQFLNIDTVLFLSAIVTLFFFLFYNFEMKERPNSVFYLFIILPILDGVTILSVRDMSVYIGYGIYFVISFIIYRIFSRVEHK